MSKTTPEEAKALMKKHCAAWSHCDMPGLAALIDEVRGVGAEPVGYRWKWDDGILNASHPLAGWQIGNGPPDIHPANKDYITVEPIFTHPAPSQPAAPVGFGRTYGGCPHCGSSNCVAMQCCMPDGKPGAAPVGLPVVGYVDPQIFNRLKQAIRVADYLSAAKEDRYTEAIVKLSDAQAAIAAKGGV